MWHNDNDIFYSSMQNEMKVSVRERVNSWRVGMCDIKVDSMQIKK